MNLEQQYKDDTGRPTLSRWGKHPTKPYVRWLKDQVLFYERAHTTCMEKITDLDLQVEDQRQQIEELKNHWPNDVHPLRDTFKKLRWMLDRLLANGDPKKLIFLDLECIEHFLGIKQDKKGPNHDPQ